MFKACLLCLNKVFVMILLSQYMVVEVQTLIANGRDQDSHIGPLQDLFWMPLMLLAKSLL